MRIALVHSFYSERQTSGENAQVEADLGTLRGAGIDARLFAVRTDEREHDRLYRVRSAVRVATGRGRSPLEAIEDFAPDVVHVHNLFPNFGRRWIEHVGVPVVATMHNFRFACSNSLLFRDGHVCTDCPDGRRWSGVRHRCYRDSYAASVPLALALRRGPAADPVLARADRILCLSQRQRAMLEAGGIERERLVDWTNFLPQDLCPDQVRPGLQSSDRNGFLYVGRLVPEKGCLELVRNWPADRLLRIVGSGPQVDEVQRAATGRRVEVLGTIPRADVVELMSRSEALVMPSLLPEGANTPLVFMEALACGLPTVVARACDVAEQVERERVGAVVDDVRDMPAAAARLAADTSQPERCRALFENRFTAEVWIARMVDLYASLVSHVRR